MTKFRKLSKAAILNLSLGGVIILIALIVFLVINPFGWFGSSEARSLDSSSLTATVQKGQVVSSISASGNLEAASQTSLNFKVSGEVASVYVELGDEVEKGDKIASLDTSDFYSAINDASATLTSAKKKLEEAEEEYSSAVAAASASASSASDSQGLSSSGANDLSSYKQAVSSAESAVEEAESKLEDAYADLENTVLYAAASGIVSSLNISAGDSVQASGSSGAGSANSSAAVISDISSFLISASVDEADIKNVSKGDSAKITLPAIDEESYEGVVSSVSPIGTVSASVVSFAIEITLSDAPSGAKIGSSADIEIVVESSAEDALYVVSSAISESDGKYYIDIVDNSGNIETTEVEIGLVGDNGTEITSGASEGDTIVIGTYSQSTSSSSDSSDSSSSGFGGGAAGFPGGGDSSGFGGGNAGGVPSF